MFGPTLTAADFELYGAPSPPSFTLQPANQSADVGETATFISNASGFPAPTYQWQRDTGGGFSDISGATSKNYTTPVLEAGDDGDEYRVIATNSEGSATSNVAILTVISPIPAFALVDRAGNYILDRNGNYIIASPTART